MKHTNMAPNLMAGLRCQNVAHAVLRKKSGRHSKTAFLVVSREKGTYYMGVP